MKCVVKVQHRPGQDEARWRSSTDPEMVVCDRHRAQYDERDDLGSHNWQEITCIDSCDCRTCKIGRLFLLALRKREGLITQEEFDAESAPIVDALWPKEPS